MAEMNDRAAYHRERYQREKEKYRAKYLERREEILARAATRLEENREEINARKRDFYRKNKARLSEVSKRYQLDNLDKFRSYNAKRRAAKNNALPVWFGEFDELVETEAASLAKLRQEATGLEWHVDHMIPLRAKLACGLHCWRNLQVIPRALNQKKKNRMLLTNPLEWITFL